MTDVKTGNMVRTAMFAALTCIATFIIKIPTPGTGGYIHPGDALVILSGIFLGPLYGAAAAGIGSAMADILGGYFFYAPVTMLIKGITAFCCGQIFRRFSSGTGHFRAAQEYHPGRSDSNALRRVSQTRINCVLCGLASIIIVTGGYLMFELLIYGRAAIASIPSNLVQGVSGLIISNLLYQPLSRIFTQSSARR